MRIAVLDDDPAQTDFVSQTLTAVGHTCYAFKEGKALKKRLQRETFDLLVLDWNVPDMSGEEVLKWVRANQTEHNLPIIFMTSRDDEAGITQILNAGADDYVVKPVSGPILRARIGSLLRRAYPVNAEATVREFDQFRFDVNLKQAYVGDKAVSLTQKEFELALLLFQHLDRPLSRAHILDLVWKQATDIPSRTMDTHISMLRTARPAARKRLSPRADLRLRLPARTGRAGRAGVTTGITQRTANLRTVALRAACAVAFAFAAQHAAAQPPTAAGKMVVYRTQAGDTLYDVAARYLQGADDWQLLQQINGVPAPKHLQPGIALKLPVARLRKEKLTARVVAVQGTAERASGDAFAPLANDATLAEGDRVRTGPNGFVTLETADGTHMSLPPDSQLDLKALRRTVLTGTLDREFELTRGSVDSEVTHLKKRDDRFQIRSPSVVAGVRGTHFRVNYDAAGSASTRVEVLDGTVGVAGGRKPADPTLVHANFGSVATSSGAVGAPVEQLPAPALAHPDKVQDGSRSPSTSRRSPTRMRTACNSRTTPGCSTCSVKRAPIRRARSSATCRTGTTSCGSPRSMRTASRAGRGRTRSNAA